MILYRNVLGIVFRTMAKYGNCFQNNRPVTINIMFNECSAVHLHLNALKVIPTCGAATPTSFQLFRVTYYNGCSEKTHNKH